MPVIQLRTPADYFGINEAPQQPLFQASQNIDPDIAFHRQMVGLRQQRPLAQAQAIQNQYSTIFNNAEKLRLEQQAAREAEQAVSALAGLTPEVDDYVAQRQEIQRQFPNAMLDPRVQRIVDDNDRMFTSRQSSLAKQQQEAADRRAKLFGLGATPQQVEAVFQNPDAAAQLEFQLGKGTSGKGSATALKSAVDLLNDEIKAMSEAGEDYEIVGEQQVMKPEYKALLDRRSKYRDAYLSEVDTAVFPQAKKTATTAAPPPPAEPQVGFKERMKGLAGVQPKEQTIPPLTPKEEMEQITQAKDSPEALMAFIQSDRGSESSKKEALKKMEEFRKNLPNFTFKEGTPEQIANLKMNLPSMIDEARQIVELQPLRREVNRAWTTEKKNLESQIQDFAKAIGVAPSLAEQWLAQNSTYTTDFDPLSDAPARKIPIREYFDEYLQGRVGKSLADEADILGRFADNKQAGKLGLKASPLDYLKAIPLNPRLILGPIGAIWAAKDVQRKGGIDYGDVLDAYLAEKVPTSAASPQNQVAQPASTVKIKSVTPVP